MLLRKMMLRAPLSLSGHLHERKMINRNDIIRVLVVSGCNDGSTMEGLYQTVDNVKDIVIVGEVNSGKEALEAARYLAPDVIVMLADSDISGMDSIETTREITGEGLSSGVVIITRNIVRNLAPAVKARAAGLCSPVAGAEELLETIYRIHRCSPYSVSLQ